MSLYHPLILNLIKDGNYGSSSTRYLTGDDFRSRKRAFTHHSRPPQRPSLQGMFSLPTFHLPNSSRAIDIQKQVPGVVCYSIIDLNHVKHCSTGGDEQCLGLSGRVLPRAKQTMIKARRIHHRGVESVSFTQPRYSQSETSAFWQNIRHWRIIDPTSDKTGAVHID